MKSSIEPGDWHLVQIDGWPLFSKQKPIHGRDGEGNNTLVFLVCCCQCCGYTCCVSVLIALTWYDCVSTHRLTWQFRTLQGLWPIHVIEQGEACWHVTQSDLVFLSVFRGPVKWMTPTQRAWSRPGQQEGERNLTRWPFCLLSLAPPFTVTTISDNTVPLPASSASGVLTWSPPLTYGGMLGSF